MPGEFNSKDDNILQVIAFNEDNLTIQIATTDKKSKIEKEEALFCINTTSLYRSFCDSASL